MIVLLHNIRSVHNVGSIFRTADALKIEKIYLCGITPSPLTELGKIRKDFIKVSLGSEKTVPWEKTKFTGAIIKKLRAKNYQILAVEQSKDSIPYYSCKTKKNNKIAIILGNEIKGIPDSILKLTDKILEIPMSGKKESLNVSVAFGIVLYRIMYP